MKLGRILLSVLVLGLLLVPMGRIGQAQELAEPPSPDGGLAVEDITPGAIPIQGRLTDSSGNPLPDGDYEVYFALYESETGGVPICGDTNTVTVKDGLFHSYLDYCYSLLHGQKVWLAVEVEGDGEMTPRQPIYAVPYALSLRPGAVISHSNNTQVLSVKNYGSGDGIYAYSANNNGVYASSGADNRAAVSGYNSSTGDGLKGISLAGVGVFGGSLASVGVEASSSFSVALKASGTGIIQSSARSYIWISGNNLRKKQSTDSTQFELDTYGGVIVRPGGSGRRDVMLPVTLPGQLYGQDVTLTGIDVYFKSQSDFDGIDATFVRRQTGAGSGDTIIADGTDHVCTTACSYHLDLTTNNILSDEQGVVYIAFQLFFGGSSNYVQIGGVRLTLEHDD